MRKPMIEKQGNHLFNKNTLTRSAALALGVLAFGGNLATPALARPKAVTPHEQPAPATTPLVINPAAVLQSRLVHKQAVTVDAFQGVNWGPNEASETTVPLVAQVDGHTEYFAVTQTQPNKFGSLRTLQVSELVDLAPDALVPETFPDITSETTAAQSGVVMLTANKAPMIEVPGVAYSDGKALFTLVGQIVPNPNAAPGPVVAQA